MVPEYDVALIIVDDADKEMHRKKVRADLLFLFDRKEVELRGEVVLRRGALR